MNEWNLIGHDAIVRRLREQVVTGKLGQSLLIVGMASVGKATLAHALAGEVLAHGARDTVRAKHLADVRKHPDLMWINADEGSVKIDAVRSLLHTLTFMPVESARRIAVVDDAHLATEESQNAILKTLEEPNPSAMLVLISPSTDGVLPTIASRCRILILHPVQTRIIYEALIKRGADDAVADLLSRLARGRPGWAVTAMQNPEMMDQRTTRLNELEVMLSANRAKRFAYSEALTKSGEETVNSVLEDWLWYWRDVVRATTDSSDTDRLRQQLHNIDRMDAIMRLAHQAGHTAAVGMVRAIASSARYLQQNARTQLVLDALLLKMPSL
jgi:DNA polymerase III subunit delta'